MTLSTFAVAASGDDGTVAKTAGVYPPTGSVTIATSDTSMNTQRLKSGANYTVRPAIIAWDTSSLPDTNTISGATLDIVPLSTNFNNADTRNLVGEWYAGYTGSIVAGDYTDTPASTAFSIALSALTTDTINTITLTNPDTNISKTGVTALRLHIDGGQPTGLNRVLIASFDHATQQEPRLNVTHAAAATNAHTSLRRGVELGLRKGVR